MHARYASALETTRAGVVVLSSTFADATCGAPARIVVDKPMDAMIPLLAHFHRDEPRAIGVHALAIVSASARIGRGVTIDAGAVVQDEVVIGDGCWIGANAVVAVGCVLGAHVRVHASATLYPYVEVGDRVVLHGGARVGREGFGFVPTVAGATRIPHIGRCVLEHDVEVGANSCVDRGSIDDTIIGAGTKIDNLCHVAHNVHIGRFCFLASQVGIAGSARIGDGVQIGGQAGIGGHLTIGDGASIGGQAGVFGDVPAGEMWSGYPARPHRDALRAQAAMFKLARLMRPLEKLLQRDVPS